MNGLLNLRALLNPVLCWRTKLGSLTLLVVILNASISENLYRSCVCVCVIPTSEGRPSSHIGLKWDRFSPLGLTAIFGNYSIIYYLE